LFALMGGGATAINFGQSYPFLGKAASAVLLFGEGLQERRPNGEEMQATYGI